MDLEPWLRNPAVLGGAALLALVVVFVAFRLVFGRRRAAYDPDAGLDEDVASFPPPPALPASHGPSRLRFNDIPMRLRLVVLAPVGRATHLDADGVSVFLDRIVRGMSSVVREDEPVVRVWPAQVSHAGFPMKFRRHVRRPEPESRSSRWIFVSGLAKLGSQQLLVGLALLADEPTFEKPYQLGPEEWRLRFRVDERR